MALPPPLPWAAGTVLYSHACSLQEELLASQEAAEAAAGGGGQRGGSSMGMGSPVMAAAAAAAAAAGSSGRGAAERAIQATFGHAAQYIALAYAMQPDKQVYGDSLAAVQRLLPLPYLRAGPLLAAHPDTAGGPEERWVACWFGLGLQGMAAVRPPAAYAAHGGLPAAPPPVAFQLADVADARLAADPSLPVGAAIWLGLGSQPRCAGWRAVGGGTAVARLCGCRRLAVEPRAAGVRGPPETSCLHPQVPLRCCCPACMLTWPAAPPPAAGACTWLLQTRMMPRAGWMHCCCCPTWCGRGAPLAWRQRCRCGGDLRMPIACASLPAASCPPGLPLARPLLLSRIAHSLKNWAATRRSWGEKNASVVVNAPRREAGGAAPSARLGPRM